MEFIYNNAKNASIDHIFFKLNYQNPPWVSYKKYLNPHSKSKTAEKLSFELQNLMAACQQNLYHASKLQNQVHDKVVQP